MLSELEPTGRRALEFSLNPGTLTAAGKTYRFRITNVGLATSLNIRFQGHTMKLVEVEGSHTMQTTYSSLDVHLGQSYSVLLTADQPAFDYAVVVSTRFTTRIVGDWTFGSTPHSRKCSLTCLQGPNEMESSIPEGIG